jgi:hypothetical protein
MTASSSDSLLIRGRQRTRNWERVTRGVYAQARPRTLAEDLSAWQLVLPPTAAFSYLTAAELRGWWLPAPTVHPVFAAMLDSDPRPRRPGLLLCRHTQLFGVSLIDGLRVTTPGETLLAAARDLGVLDLVIMGDSALRLKHCTVTDLTIVAHQRRRGAPLLRQVIPMLDPRSESAWESIMRVLHRAADIPVLVQEEIHNQFGHLLGRADLLIEGTRRLQEYDGAGHRDAETHAGDLARDRGLLADNWQRHGYVSQDLLHGGAEIIADVDRTLGRSWDSRRLAAWQNLVKHSLYGRAGRGRAWRRWKLQLHTETGQVRHSNGRNPRRK